MISIYSKLEKDGSTELLIVNKGSKNLIYFNSFSFEIKNFDYFNFMEYEKIKFDYKLTKLNEIRNEDTDVYYLKFNTNIIIQINWVHIDNDMIQRVSIFYNDDLKPKNTNNPSIYDLAILRFNNAEVYEDINLIDLKWH